MAKSLRASSKVKARNARRYNEKTDYAVTHAARLNAISSRLAQRVAAKEDGDDDDDDDAEEQLAADDKMEAEAEGQELAATAQKDQEAKPKISTSGTRENRRETWRKEKGWKPKQGSKNNGRTKRRK